MLAGVVDLALGNFHSILVKQDGSVWCSGLNSNGQLGITLAITFSKRFVQVIASEALAAAAGFGHSMVLTQDGNVWVTGQNSKGQLGDGSKASTGTFLYVQITGTANMVYFTVN